MLLIALVSLLAFTNCAQGLRDTDSDDIDSDDGQGGAVGGTSNALGAGGAEGTGAGNLPPVIDDHYQSATAVFATEQVALSVTAYDPEGAPLSFLWTTSGGTLGTADDTASSSHLFWEAPPEAGVFTVTAEVQDPGAQAVMKTFSIDVSGLCNDGIQNYGEDSVDCGGPCSPCPTQSQAFSFTGNGQTFTVPSGVNMLTFHLWGAGGGGGSVDHSNMGGAGGYAYGQLAVTPGTVYTIMVGGGGGSGFASPTYGGGGAGGDAVHPGSAGGGRSAIRLNGSDLLTAGGGGGGARYVYGVVNGGAYGGPGGGLIGGDGGNGLNTLACNGTGGTQSAGGFNNYNSGWGEQYLGGTFSLDMRFSSGGGGGYFGGGAGNFTSACAGAGAGGGSGFISTNILGGLLEQGTGATPPQMSSPYYQSGIGVGGVIGQQGGNGHVVVLWDL